MYSSYSLSKYLVSIHIVSIQFFLMRSVSSLNLIAYLNHKCRVNEGKYQIGSKYEENLNYLIKSISTYKFENGFEHISYGEAPNSVAIIFQCRGDSYGSKCLSCFVTAVAGLQRRCERNKGEIIWYDQCFLDVSMNDRRPPRKIDYENTVFMHNPKNVNRVEEFNKNLENFLYKLLLKANRLVKVGDEPIYYAAGENSFRTDKLYAVV